MDGSDAALVNLSFEPCYRNLRLHVLAGNYARRAEGSTGPADGFSNSSRVLILWIFLKLTSFCRTNHVAA